MEVRNNPVRRISLVGQQEKGSLLKKEIAEAKQNYSGSSSSVGLWLTDLTSGHVQRFNRGFQHQFSGSMGLLWMPRADLYLIGNLLWKKQQLREVDEERWEEALYRKEEWRTKPQVGRRWCSEHYIVQHRADSELP